MNRSIKILFLASCLLSAKESSAQQLMSLDSILSAIRSNNPRLKSVINRAEAMTAFAQGAGNIMAPEVGGGLWMFPYAGSKEIADNNKGQIMVSVRQQFTNPHKLRATRAYLDSKTSIEKANESIIYNELRASAKTAFFQWIVMEREKRILQENEAVIQLLLKISKLRYPYNQAGLGNIYKAEGRLLEVQNMILSNNSDIIQRNIILNQLMNLDPGVRFQIDTMRTYRPFLVDPVDRDLIAESQSEVRRIDRTIESLQFNQSLERAQAKPDFSVSYNHMIPRGSGMPSQFMLSGMISIPIAPWSSKAYKANIQGINGQVESLKRERESIISEIEGMAERSLYQISSLQRQVVNYEDRILPVLRKNYDVLMLAYEENREELPIVIDGYETLILSQIQYLDTLRKYYEEIVTYEKLVEK